MPLALHVIGYNLGILKEKGCELAYPPEMFKALMLATRGDPCTTGCAFFDDGKCKAYQEYHTTPIEARYQAKIDRQKASTDQSGLIGGKWKGMTSKEIRKAEGGISPAEFQRRKQAGNYTS